MQTGEISRSLMMKSIIKLITHPKKNLRIVPLEMKQCIKYCYTQTTFYYIHQTQRNQSPNLYTL